MRLEHSNGQLFRQVEIETDFLPKAGEVVNAYEVFDDVDTELDGVGWFFTVYSVDWSIEKGSLTTTVKLIAGSQESRLQLLRRQEWFPPAR